MRLCVCSASPVCMLQGACCNHVDAVQVTLSSSALCHQVLTNATQKKKKIKTFGFPCLLCSPLGLKGKGRHLASRDFSSVGGKGSRAGG